MSCDTRFWEKSVNRLEGLGRWARQAAHSPGPMLRAVVVVGDAGMGLRRARAGRLRAHKDGVEDKPVPFFASLFFFFFFFWLVGLRKRRGDQERERCAPV